MQESSSPLWCSGRPAASSLAPSALSSTWTPSSSTPVSSIPPLCSCKCVPPRGLCIDFCPASPQVSCPSLQTTRGGSAPGGPASSCAVPYSSARLSSCSASLSRCRPRRERRGWTASRLCFLPLSVQNMRLQSRVMGSYATTRLPTAPPAVSSSGVSVH